MVIGPGNVVHIGAAASMQFAGARSLTIRVIRVDPRPTYHGWIWLDGYVLNAKGVAIGQRAIFVRRVGVRQISDPLTA